MEFHNNFRIFCLCIFLHVCRGELIMIQVVMRHTDRNPFPAEAISEFYPKDPNLNRPAGATGYAQVNEQGKAKAVAVGQFFSRQYGSLFANDYSKANISFRTANLPRTNDTAYLIAQGLFSASPSFNETLARIPIDIATTAEAEDRLFFAYAICRDWLDEKSSIRCKMQDELAGQMPNLAEFYEHITRMTGRKVWSPTNFWILYQFLYSQMMVGYELQDWTKGIFPHGKMEQLAAASYVLQTYTPKMKRLMGGAFIREFLNNADRVIAGADSRNAFFYIGTEVQIATLLTTMGIFDYQVPGYASFIIFELHRHRNKYYVQVSYKNGDTLGPLDFDPIVKQIPHCPKPWCPLATFRSTLSAVTPGEIGEDCGKLKPFEWIPS